MLSLRGQHGDRLPFVPQDLSFTSSVVWMYQAIILVWVLWSLSALIFWLRWGIAILREQRAERRARDAAASKHGR